MKNRLRRFHPKFASDLQVANSYYDDISTDLGNRLRATIRTQLQLISESPEAFGIIKNNFRAVRLAKFPYIILYRPYPDHVFVVGLVHAASDRKHWFDRVD